MSEPIVVIGTGPAGVSAARPLLDAGFPLTMIDAGHKISTSVRMDRPALVALRQGSPLAWQHLIGNDSRGLRWMPSVSPKLRLAHAINGVIARERLTQAAAAKNAKEQAEVAKAGLVLPGTVRVTLHYQAPTGCPTTTVLMPRNNLHNNPESSW